MNRKSFKFLTILFVLLISIFFNIKDVSALDITCQYRLLQPLFSTASGLKLYDDPNNWPTRTMTYTLKDKKHSIVDEYKNFESSSFTKTVEKNSKCPSFVYVSGTVNRGVKEITKEDFTSYYTKYSSTTATKKSIATPIGYYTYNYPDLPMFLVNQDNSVIKENADFATDVAFGVYEKYLNTYENQIKTNCNVDDITPLVNNNRYDKSVVEFNKYVNGDYSTTTKDSKDNQLSESCWNSRQNYIKVLSNSSKFETQAVELYESNGLGSSNDVSNLSHKKKIEEHEFMAYCEYDEISNLNSQTEAQEYRKDNYCALYCELMKCQDMEGSALTACVNSCNQSNDCTKALPTCSKFTNDQAFNYCMKANMPDIDEYNTKRDAKLSEYDQEIEDTKERLYRPIAKVKQLVLGLSEYELTCEDVKFLHAIWIIMWIISPVLVIVFGTVDYFRAVIASDPEEMKKVKKKFPRRIIALLFLIFAPVLVALIVSLINIGETSNTKIMYCIINGGE